MTETATAPLKSLDDMPSPKGLPILGDMMDFVDGEAPWDVMLRYAREIGPVSRVDLPGSDIVLVSDPDAITQIMVTNSSDFYKKTPTAALRPVSTDKGDVFTQPGGAVWAERKAANPMVIALQGNWMADVLPQMQADISERVSSWIGQTFTHTYDELLHMAFDVFSNMLYGTQFEVSTFRDWVTVADALDHRMKSKLPFMLDSLPEEAGAAQDRNHADFQHAVKEARADTKPDGPDLLRYSLRNGCDHDDSLLATELANMYYGGIVSSSTTVATTLYLLCKSDVEKERVVNALVALGENPSAEAITQCEELQAAVFEALRLLPPVSLWTRNVRGDYPAAVGDYLVPPETSLLIGNRYAHRNADHWEDAESFKPSRWTAELRASDPPGSAWFFPFGRGERTCLAQDLGLAYIYLAVGTILLDTDPQVGLAKQIDQDFWFGCMVPKNLRSEFEPNHS
jgi:cytochrome P450